MTVRRISHFGRCVAAMAVPIVLATASRSRADDHFDARPVGRMNDVQLLATHNSYHIAPEGPGIPRALAYTHAPLGIQLEELGVRGFELDLHFDSVRMRFDVFHTDADTSSTCPELTQCLTSLKEWSDRNPQHAPLIVQLEVKDAFETINPADYYATLEREILSVWPSDRLVTPDFVQGNAATLREAITTRGWPLVEAVRGRVMFALEASDAHRAFYTHGDNDLRGRLLFIHASPSAPYAGFIVINNPMEQSTEIEEAVEAGFIVRTRADANLVEPSVGDDSRLRAAVLSGAQLISTDLPSPVPGYDCVVRHSLEFQDSEPQSLGPKAQE